MGISTGQPGPAGIGTCCPTGCGTIFKITPGGTLTTLYSFCAQANCPDGTNPGAGLVQGRDGNLYGTTTQGGANASGTIFKITPGGTLSALYSFCAQPGCADGFGSSRLVQGTDGDWYGTTGGGGGTAATGYRCPYTGCGTVYKITVTGALTTLHSFDGADGDGSSAAIIQGTDGNFYGTTGGGGPGNACATGIYGCGTVFKISPGGMLTTLYDFCSGGAPNCTDGANPDGGLVQGTDGNFYGTTSTGGDLTCSAPPVYGCGTVFRLSAGLSPFAETNPTSGRRDRQSLSWETI